MGWNINLVENTVTVPEAAVPELLALNIDSPWYDHYGEGSDILPFDEDGRLLIDDDAMEHKDYIWNKELQEVLKKHKVNGEIIFSSWEGDNRGQAWGYRFVDGECTELAGKAKDMKLSPV